ncbi:MAG: DUF4445 domain-containing protein, partial [Desulfovibrio sp.]|nr:DUF4445 domain-containing protein [Desulfovibrio sp.]
LLIDLGTNAEFALFDHNGQLFVTSVPMGPAMEGIGMYSGHVAGETVITQVSLDSRGIAAKGPKGPLTKACGIAATGYLSLLSELKKRGLLSADGHFVTKQTMPLFAAIMRKVQAVNGLTRLSLPQGVFLTLDDIEAMLKVKASFTVALQSLLASAAMDAQNLAHIYMAGALGEYVDTNALEELGFIPHGLGSRVEAVGNAALSGASLLLTDTNARKELTALCAKAQVLQLPDDPRFEKRFIAAMHFASF